MMRSPKSRRGPVAKAPPKGAARGPQGVIQPAILAALAAGYRSCAELVAAIPDSNPSGIHAALRRMVEVGTIVKAGHGRYDLLPGAPTAPARAGMTRDQVRDHVMLLAPGTVVGFPEICALGASRNVVASAFAAMEKGGDLVRIASGRYARGGPGTFVLPDDEELPRYAQVARLLSGASVMWSTQSIQAALVAPRSPREARWILDSMYKEGWVERPLPSMWKLTAEGRGLFQPKGRLADPTGDVLAALTPGRVTEVAEVAAATGLSIHAAGLVLDRLEADGLAIHVVYGFWRPAWTPASLDPDSGPLKARALARLIDRPGPCSARELGDGLGMDPAGYYKGVDDLVEEGVAVRVRRGHVELDVRWRQAIRARLDAKGIRPRLSPTDAMLVRIMRETGPWDETALASKAGMGSEALSESLGRIRAMGRLLDVDPGRYMLA